MYSAINVISLIWPSASTVKLHHKMTMNLLNNQVSYIVNNSINEFKIMVPFTWIKNYNKGRAFASFTHSSALFQGLNIFFGKNLIEKPHVVTSMLDGQKQYQYIPIQRTKNSNGKQNLSGNFKFKPAFHHFQTWPGWLI